MRKTFCHREGRALDILRDTWAAHEGTVCRGINWERQPLEELAAIADCVGGAGLAACATCWPRTTPAGAVRRQRCC